MTSKYRLAPNGKRAVYLEISIFYNPATRHIHVPMPDVMGVKGTHWSYPRGSREYAYYREVLIEMGRWPSDADAPTAKISKERAERFMADDDDLVITHAGGDSVQ